MMFRRFLLIFSFMLLTQTITSEFSTTDNENSITACQNDTKLEGEKYCKQKHNEMYCYGGMDTFHRIREKTTKLLLVCWPNKSLDPQKLLTSFPNLKILQIENSTLKSIIYDFPAMEHLEIVNISFTNLGHIRSSLFQNLKSLKFLDLRYNQLDTMDSPFLLPNRSRVYLNENRWNCANINLNWMLNYSNNKNVDMKELRCSDMTYGGRPLLFVMKFKQKLEEECKHPDLNNCSCVLSFIRRSEHGDKEWIPMYTINCSNLGFYQLPSYIPRNTTSFYATDNKISHIHELRDEMYENVNDIYLDNNLIKSIAFLEQGKWLNQFRVFSLRGNLIKKIELHILEKTLEINHQIQKIFLSNNPWKCTCTWTPKFQAVLMKYNTLITDSANVTCGEGANLGSPVLSLKVGDVCRLPTEYSIYPLDMVNLLLASLILLVLGKLAYDYYYYKKYGKIPWIVIKMP